MTGLAWQVEKRLPGAAEDSGQLDQETLPETSALPVVPKARYQAVRTVVDPLCAALLLVVCAPLMLAVWSAIRLSSPGPALFRQRRAGKHGKPFTILKFRTMRPEAPVYSVKIAEHDPHITTVGRFLRRSGLDELPQLWNVVRGEMAIIGPRPEQLELIDIYQPWQHQRHLVKPGITGWWQIHHRDGVPLHLNVGKDLYYIRHQSARLDSLIIVGTCSIVLGAVVGAFRGPRRGLDLPTFVGSVSKESAAIEHAVEGALTGYVSPKLAARDQVVLSSTRTEHDE